MKMKKKIKKSLAVSAIAFVMGAGAFTNGFHVNEVKAQTSIDSIRGEYWLDFQRGQLCETPGPNCLSTVVIKG